MARKFVRASTQYLTHAASPLSAYPFTWSCWYQHTGNPSSYLCSFANSGSYAFKAMVCYLGTVYLTNTGSDDAGVAAANTANVWLHAAGVFASNTSRTCYTYDGTTKAKGTATATRAWTTVNNTNFGALFTGGTSYSTLDGKMAEIGCWNVELTEAEIDILRAGFSPLCVRPASLVGYWPLMGQYSPEIDLVGRYEMTLTNAPTAADHCRIILPPPRMLAGVPDAVATRRTMMLMGCGA